MGHGTRTFSFTAMIEESGRIIISSDLNKIVSVAYEITEGTALPSRVVVSPRQATWYGYDQKGFGMTYVSPEIQ